MDFQECFPDNSFLSSSGFCGLVFRYYFFQTSFSAGGRGLCCRFGEGAISASLIPADNIKLLIRRITGHVTFGLRVNQGSAIRVVCFCGEFSVLAGKHRHATTSQVFSRRLSHLFALGAWKMRAAAQGNDKQAAINVVLAHELACQHYISTSSILCTRPTRVGSSSLSEPRLSPAFAKAIKCTKYWHPHRLPPSGRSG